MKNFVTALTAIFLIFSGMSAGAQCSADLNPTNPSCGLNNGAVDLNIFNATPPFTYHWSNGATTQDISGLGPGTYTVTFTDAIGCSAVNPVTLVAVAPFGVPTASFAMVTSSLTATFTNNSIGATNYQWNFGDGQVSTAVNPTHTYANSGVYAVVLIATNSCGPAIYTQTVTVSMPTPPTVDITATQTTVSCGSSITLSWTSTNAMTATASGGWSGAKPVNGTLVVNGLTTTTTFNITVTGNGGSATDQVTVYVTPLTATILANGPTTFCQGGNVTLTASGGATYLWSNGATTSNITVTQTGTYTVTVSNGSGCAATATKLVTVNPVPTGLTLSPISVSATGNYNVTLTNASGCTATAQLPVTVNCTPAVVYVDTCFGGGTGNAIDNDNDGYVNWLDCNDNNASINPGAVEICNNGIDDNCNGQQNEGCGSNEVCDGIDNDGDGQIDEGFPNFDGDNMADCVDPDDDNDSVLDATDCNDSNPSVYPGALELCDGLDNDCDGQINEGLGPIAGFTLTVSGLTVTFINTSTNALSYAWNFGNGSVSIATNPTYTYSGDGTYTITLTANNSCGSSVATVTFTLFTTPPPSCLQQGITNNYGTSYGEEICLSGAQLILSAPGNPQTNNFDWSPSNGEINNGKNYFPPQEPGTYFLSCWVTPFSDPTAAKEYCHEYTILPNGCFVNGTTEGRGDPSSVNVFPNPTSGSTTVELSNYPAGTYFINVMDETGRSVIRKVIKQ